MPVPNRFCAKSSASNRWSAGNFALCRDVPILTIRHGKTGATSSVTFQETKSNRCAEPLKAITASRSWLNNMLFGSLKNHAWSGLKSKTAGKN